MQKFIVVILCFYSCTFYGRLQAQNTSTKSSKPKKNFWKKFHPGGNIGASFSDPVFVNVSPLLGYQATDKFQLGLGATYLYQNPNTSPPRHNYGGRAYAKYQVYKPIFLWAEMEGLNVEETFPDGSSTRAWQYAPLLGGGLQISLGGKGGIYFQVLYQVNHNNDSWRTSPWETRIGFSL